MIKNSGVYKSTFTAIDGESGCQAVIDSDHAQIHAGRFYSMFTANTNAANGDSAFLEIITPLKPQGEIHLKGLSASTSAGKVLITVTEAPTCTPGVATFIPINRKRYSGNTSGLTVKTDPTNIAGGTIVDQFYLGAAGQGIVLPLDELELIPDTKYIIEMKNIAGGAAVAMYLKANYYEVID